MTMSHVDNGIPAQEVQVFFPIYIPCFGPFGSRDSDLAGK